VVRTTGTGLVRASADAAATKRVLGVVRRCAEEAARGQSAAAASSGAGHVEAGNHVATVRLELLAR